MRRVIIHIHTNLGHQQNSTLAKMISNVGGSEEIIKCANRCPCSVCKRMSRSRLRRPVSVPRTRQFNDTLLSDVHFWNFQGRDVLVNPLIDEATRFHVTQILNSQSTRDLCGNHDCLGGMGKSTTFSVGSNRTWLVSSLSNWERKVRLFSWELQKRLVTRHGTYIRSMMEKMVYDGVPDDMSAQTLFDRATSAKNMMNRIRGYSPSQWVLATQPRIPESLMIDDEDERHSRKSTR